MGHFQKLIETGDIYSLIAAAIVLIAVAIMFKQLFKPERCYLLYWKTPNADACIKSGIAYDDLELTVVKLRTNNIYPAYNWCVTGNYYDISKLKKFFETHKVKFEEVEESIFDDELITICPTIKYRRTEQNECLDKCLSKYRPFDTAHVGSSGCLGCPNIISADTKHCELSCRYIIGQDTKTREIIFIE